MDLWMTAEEAAPKLRRSASTVRRLIASGALRATNVGSDLRPAYRVSQTAIDEFMAERELEVA